VVHFEIPRTEDVESVRARYRPKRITTLFVGESATHSGNFFYYGNTAMFSHMRSAVESSFGKNDDFLETFKAYGWYLDDLVSEPVNRLPKPKRFAKCMGAQKSLADRIADYRPKAIVSLLESIEPIVNAASAIAGSDAAFYGVPFPGVGHQTKFRDAMAVMLPKLPRLTGAKLSALQTVPLPSIGS